MIKKVDLIGMTPSRWFYKGIKQNNLVLSVGNYNSAN